MSRRPRTSTPSRSSAPCSNRSRCWTSSTASRTGWAAIREALGRPHHRHRHRRLRRDRVRRRPAHRAAASACPRAGLRPRALARRVDPDARLAGFGPVADLAARADPVRVWEARSWPAARARSAHRPRRRRARHRLPGRADRRGDGTADLHPAADAADHAGRRWRSSSSRSRCRSAVPSAAGACAASTRSRRPGS